MEIREELDLRPLYWKKAIEVYYAVVIAVAVVAGIVSCPMYKSEVKH